MKDASEFTTSAKGEYKDSSFYTVILFSDSHGYRLKKVGPVQFAQINRKTLLQSQVEAITKKFNNCEIILGCGFDATSIAKYVREKFKRVNIRIVENQLFRNSNSCESVRMCLLNTMNHKIVFCSASCILGRENLDCIDYSKTSVLTENACEDKFKIKVYADENGNCRSMNFGEGGLDWSEIFYISNEKDLKLFNSILETGDYKNKFLFEAINKMAQKTVIKTYANHHKQILKLDSTSKLKEIK
jgi:hypothetical protein